jgi:glycosyltransferase involved in cell wall biosynthesis
LEEVAVRILWVKADKLLPVHNGGNIRSYHMLRQLALRHEVTLFSYYGGAIDAEYEAALGREFPGAVGFCTKKQPLAGLMRGADYIFHLSTPAPYAISRFASLQVQEKLAAWFRENRFDAAICDFLDAAVNFPTSPVVPSFLFQHNVESEIWRRHAETELNPIKKYLYRVEFAKMLHYEQTMVRQFHHVIAVSEHDRQLMGAWADQSRISVVPTGVDLREYRPAAAPQEVGLLVVFVGAMDWEPNIDAVEYFCQTIWPSIQAQVPDSRFRIVGRNPGGRVQRLASGSVEVTGSVPRVLDHLREAAVVVVPLRIGGGTRLKIYEAMAAGKAVVSTSIGAEGLDVHHGTDVMLADDADGFAGATITLLHDRELRRRYESAAARLATRYDWSAIGERFAEILETVVHSGQQCAGAPI